MAGRVIARSGKSGGLNVVMGNLAARRDVVIWALDLKRGMELGPWAACIARLATDEHHSVGSVDGEKDRNDRADLPKPLLIADVLSAGLKCLPSSRRSGPTWQPA